MEEIKKVVIDTNIFVSAHIAGGTIIQEIIDKWIEEKFILLISKPILEEIIEVFKRKRIEAKKIEKLLNLISQKAILIEPKEKLEIIKDDPEDNKFLECAVEGKADYIVSGDIHLLSLKKYKDIPIFKVREFIKLV